MSPRSIWRTAIVAVVLVIATASANAQSKAGLGVSPQAIKAKTDYCKTCHGIEGQGFRGSLPMPRLAGQQPDVRRRACARPRDGEGAVGAF